MVSRYNLVKPLGFLFNWNSKSEEYFLEGWYIFVETVLREKRKRKREGKMDFILVDIF